MLGFYNRVLRNFGCTCFEAEDGDDCVRMYSDRVDSGDVTYDLVLMDFVMPSAYACHTLLPHDDQRCLSIVTTR